MAGETYDRKTVEAERIELDHGDKIAEIAVQVGETAWNPLSAKGPMYGGQIIKYVWLSGGINVGLYPLGQCVGINEVRKPGESFFRYQQCTEKIGKTEVRCSDHVLSK